MVKLDAIWSLARADLVVKTERGGEDVFLWEHSARVARTAQQITQLTELRSNPPDETSLTAAALYHDAGWLTLLREGRISRLEIGARVPSENHRELSASLMEASLAGHLADEALKRASEAIRSLHDRQTSSLEARVVAEAENLNEIGALSFWTTIRRGRLDGKGIQSVIDTWRRQKEYRFWTARINDSFRFEAVKELAKKRLAQFDRFMEELEQQHSCGDLVF